MKSIHHGAVIDWERSTQRFLRFQQLRRVADEAKSIDAAEAATTDLSAEAPTDITQLRAC